MMQFLVGEEIFFGIVSSLYGTVAKIYDILLNLVENGGSFDNYNFDDIMTAMYVLAGVFMLFRIIVSMLQMLVNPDLVSDKNVGAGKLISRVVICVIMLLLFVPNGLLFGASGLFHKMELALLADDGLINNVMPYGSNVNDKNYKKQKIGNKKSTVSSSNNSSVSQIDCYYANISANSNLQTMAPGTNPKVAYANNGMYHVTFYDSKNVKGKTGVINDKYAYKIDVSGKFENLPGNGKISKGNVFNTKTFPTSCPKTFNLTSGSYNSAKNQYKNKHSIFEQCIGTGSTGSCTNSGITLAGKSESSLESKLANIGLSASKGSTNTITTNVGTGDSTDSEGNSVGKLYLENVSDSAIAFSQNVARSFQECVSEKEEECTESQTGGNGNGDKDAKQGMFANSDADDKLIELYKSNELHLDFILSVVVGIALVVYLVVLCVDVVIRRFKLMLLEVMAPLPIISYVDPKDKVFNNWFKMYISTYLDLFIKLIAIALAINLLMAVRIQISDERLLVKFFYIVAILIFAKLVPSMISKIFGIDSLGGSFKDIVGMGKKALGIGAGAAALGAAGIIGSGAKAISAWKGADKDAPVRKKLSRAIGAGAAGLAKATGSVMQGAGAGYKGGASGIMNAVKASAKDTGKVMQSYKDGMNTADLIAANTIGKINMNYAGRADRKMREDADFSKELNRVTEIKSEMEKAGDGSKLMATIKSRIANGQYQDLGQNELDDIRDAWIQAQITGDTSQLETKLKKISAEGPIDYDSTKLIEKGKQSSIREQFAAAQSVIKENATIRDTVTHAFDEYEQDGVVIERKDGIVLTQDGLFADYESIKDANTIAKKHQSKISMQQRKIKEEAKYRNSQDAREIVSGESSDKNK